MHVDFWLMSKIALESGGKIILISKYYVMKIGYSYQKIMKLVLTSCHNQKSIQVDCKSQCERKNNKIFR